MKFGVDLRRYDLNAISPPNPTGAFGFTTTGTDQQGVANTGNAIASFLLGQVDNFQSICKPAKFDRETILRSTSRRDDWKVSPKLTLNLGARYTLHHPSTEVNNQGAVFNLDTQQLQYIGAEWVSAIGAGTL